MLVMHGLIVSKCTPTYLQFVSGLVNVRLRIVKVMQLFTLTKTLS